MKKRIFLMLLLSIMYPSTAAHAAVKDLYVCGIAIGFPPYQYADERNQPAGIDYEITKLVFENAGLKVAFVQSEWDDVMFSLAHRTGKVDLICGAEISDTRRQMFNFSDACYSRRIVLFVLENSPIRKISDLHGRIIAGDRHSFFERYLGNDKDRIRIKTTASKEDSFLQLKAGSVVGVIAPREVGYYISRKKGIAVKILEEKDPGSPVAFAVAKGNEDLLRKINASLKKLSREGKIEKILRKYR